MRMEKLDLALARLARSSNPSASKVEAATEAALKYIMYGEDLVSRLSAFFFDSIDSRLAAIYVIDAVLTAEKKKLKQHIVADLFESRLKSIMEAFSDSNDKERTQIAKVLGRWKKYEIFSESSLNALARYARTSVGADSVNDKSAHRDASSKTKPSKGLKVSFASTVEEREHDGSHEDYSKANNDGPRPGGQLETTKLLESLSRAKQSSRSEPDVVDLGSKRSRDEPSSKDTFKRQQPEPPAPVAPPPPPPEPTSNPSNYVKSSIRGMPKGVSGAHTQPHAPAPPVAPIPPASSSGAPSRGWASFSKPAASEGADKPAEEKPKSGWGKFT